MTMDEPEAVAAFHEAGAEMSLPVYDFNARALSRLLPRGGRLLDLGCGSARLLGYLARCRPDIRIIGCDLSEAMLLFGRRWLTEIRVEDRVELRKVDITTFTQQLPDAFDAISCVWALHHLPTDDLLVTCLRGIAAVHRRSQCAVWLFDFARYRDPRTFPAMLATFRTPGPAAVREATVSERAAFTYHELRAHLDTAGLGGLRGARSRVSGMYQCHWLPGNVATELVPWQEPPLAWNLRGLAMLMRREFPADVGT